MPGLSSLLYGRPESPAAFDMFRAGPLRLRYEPASGFVRRIQLGEREVLRGIYVAVRDPNWDTVPGTVVETRREILDDGFRLEFECRHRQAEIEFVWHGIVTGSADGVVRYSFDGEARSTFRRNRIGICVLHPIRECAGAAARQTRVDGSRVECRFPDTIERQIFGQNRFRDLRALAHEVEPGVWAEVSFEGDVFETEDQRNWTDASFKTYGTPLALPFPVEIAAGTRIRQSITLRLAGWEAVRPGLVIEGDTPVRPIRIAPADGATTPMPRLGLGLASHEQPLTPSQARRLRALGLAHLRVDLRLGSRDWPRLWERAAVEAEQLGVSLELALHLSRDETTDWAELRRQLEGRRVSLARVLALREGEAATTTETLAAVRRAVDGWPTPVGAGSDANFCELNREQALGRCVPAEADFVFWSINPQVHALDDVSVMETLEAQAATVRSARAFAGGKPLVVTPVTLRPRFNAVATRREPAPQPGELPRPVDPRQAGLFGAAWTLGSVAALASARVDAITYYETTGWRGVLELDDGPSLPALFSSAPGVVFPLYHIFAETAVFAGGEVLPVTSSDPRSVVALAARHGGERFLLLANLGPEPRTVDLEAFTNLPFFRSLTTDNLVEAAGDPRKFQSRMSARRPGPLRLSPFAIACLRGSP